MVHNMRFSCCPADHVICTYLEAQSILSLLLPVLFASPLNSAYLPLTKLLEYSNYWPGPHLAPATATLPEVEEDRRAAGEDRQEAHLLAWEWGQSGTCRGVTDHLLQGWKPGAASNALSRQLGL